MGNECRWESLLLSSRGVVGSLSETAGGESTGGKR